MEKLISSFRFELVEDHHHTGSGRYGLLLTLPDDISPVLPYLNAVLADTYYDQQNRVLIGDYNKVRCAFRPNEIQVGMISDAAQAGNIAAGIVDMVNKTWQEHDRIVPSTKERKRPTTYAIFSLLPHTNCKQCGYPTCLAYAADLCQGKTNLERCAFLLKPEHTAEKQKLTELIRP